MKRIPRKLISLLLLCALIALCACGASAEESSADKARGHYTFQPKVCSVYMEEVFGKTMCETWFRLVDAVMAGEDTFACPDKDTYNWVMGQFRDKCFPPLVDLIDYCYDRPNPIKNGMGSFVYTVPREEAAQRIAAFAQQIEDILNENLEDDYTDFEKALALYQYIAHNYTYDYSAYEAVLVGYPSWLSSYRVFTTGNGICQELSVAYAYLLMQAGVEATNMSGWRSYDHERHQWTYVRMNSHNYHIDPTYVIAEPSLRFFMMDDAQREAADDYHKENYTITSNYAQDHPHPAYAADDPVCSPLWSGTFLSLDREAKLLYYTEYDDSGEIVTRTFSYAGMD